nr:vacuolar iron transporter homolog 4-like [Ipomoea batatas]
MAKINDQESNQEVDFSKRSQWLRAALLGANDGLLSTASLMMGVGAVRKDARTMVLAGIAGLVAGACSMAIGEFVSVYSQHDMAVAEMERKGSRPRGVARVWRVGCLSWEGSLREVLF